MKGVIAAPICIGLLQLPSKVLYLAVGGQSGVVSCLHAPETTWPAFQTGQMYVSLEKLEELFTKNFPSCVEEASNGGRLSLALPQFLDLSRSVNSRSVTAWRPAFNPSLTSSLDNPRFVTVSLDGC